MLATTEDLIFFALAWFAVLAIIAVNGAVLLAQFADVVPRAGFLALL